MDDQWYICGDLNILGMLLGQLQRYTKYSCYICEWASRNIFGENRIALEENN